MELVAEVGVAARPCRVFRLCSPLSPPISLSLCLQLPSCWPMSLMTEQLAEDHRRKGPASAAPKWS